jgi:hypothetical protein
MKTRVIFYTVIMLFMVSNLTYSAVEITIDGSFDDWKDVPVLLKDPLDIGEKNGDIKELKVYSTADTFYAMMTVYGTAAPKDAQRYYYHVLIDADNNLQTGFNNSMYDDVVTGVKSPIGADFYAQIGRDNGADSGIAVNFLTSKTDDLVAENFKWAAGGDSLELAVPYEMFKPLQDIGEIFKVRQTVMIAAFQEGSANNWEVDWTEPAEHVIGVPAAVEPVGKLTTTWGQIKDY